MRLYSKCYEEKRMVFDEKERDLMGDCVNLIVDIMKEFTGSTEDVTLPSPDDDDEDYEYDGHDFYSTLSDMEQLLTNLLMTGVIVGRSKVEKKLK